MFSYRTPDKNCEVLRVMYGRLPLTADFLSSNPESADDVLFLAHCCVLIQSRLEIDGNRGTTLLLKRNSILIDGHPANLKSYFEQIIPLSEMNATYLSVIEALGSSSISVGNSVINDLAKIYLSDQQGAKFKRMNPNVIRNAVIASLKENGNEPCDGIWYDTSSTSLYSSQADPTAMSTPVKMKTSELDDLVAVGSFTEQMSENARFLQEISDRADSELLRKKKKNKKSDKHDKDEKRRKERVTEKLDKSGFSDAKKGKECANEGELEENESGETEEGARKQEVFELANDQDNENCPKGDVSEVGEDLLDASDNRASLLIDDRLISAKSITLGRGESVSAEKSTEEDQSIICERVDISNSKDLEEEVQSVLAPTIEKLSISQKIPSVVQDENSSKRDRETKDQEYEGIDQSPEQERKGELDRSDTESTLSRESLSGFSLSDTTSSSGKTTSSEKAKMRYLKGYKRKAKRILRQRYRDYKKAIFTGSDLLKVLTYFHTCGPGIYNKKMIERFGLSPSVSEAIHALIKDPNCIYYRFPAIALILAIQLTDVIEVNKKAVVDDFPSFVAYVYRMINDKFLHDILQSHVYTRDLFAYIDPMSMISLSQRIDQHLTKIEQRHEELTQGYSALEYKTKMDNLLYSLNTIGQRIVEKLPQTMQQQSTIVAKPLEQPSQISLEGKFSQIPAEATRVLPQVSKTPSAALMKPFDLMTMSERLAAESMSIKSTTTLFGQSPLFPAPPAVSTAHVERSRASVPQNQLPPAPIMKEFLFSRDRQGASPQVEESSKLTPASLASTSSFAHSEKAPAPALRNTVSMDARPSTSQAHDKPKQSGNLMEPVIFMPKKK